MYRYPDEIEKKQSAPSRGRTGRPSWSRWSSRFSNELTRICEQRGITDGHDLEDWLQAEWEIKATQADAAAA